MDDFWTTPISTLLESKKAHMTKGKGKQQLEPIKENDTKEKRRNATDNERKKLGTTKIAGRAYTRGNKVIAAKIDEVQHVGCSKRKDRYQKGSEQGEYDGDDDFVDVVPLKRKRPTKVKQDEAEFYEQGLQSNVDVIAEKSKSKLKSYPSIWCRTGTRFFVPRVLDVLQKNKDDKYIEQIADVIELGFEPLLGLTNRNQPVFLGHWLVENFNPHNHSIKMCDGTLITLDDVDVRLALGFPMGPNKVHSVEDEDTWKAIDEWKQVIKPGKSHVYPSDVYDWIYGLGGKGGELFKRSFMLLVITQLLEGNKNGQINVRYFKHTMDLNKVKSFNWCDLLIDRLISAKLEYLKNPTTPFIGSMMFLLLTYADRVQWVRILDHKRTNPIFIEWTNDSLVKREKKEMVCGGFGNGIVIDRQQLHLVEPTPSRLMGLKHRYMEEMKKLSACISNIVGLTIEAVAANVEADDDVKRMTETTKRLIGDFSTSTKDIAGSQVDDVAWCQTQQPFWSDPEFIACYEAIEEALAQKARLREVHIESDVVNVDDITAMPSSFEEVANIAYQYIIDDNDIVAQRTLQLTQYLRCQLWKSQSLKRKRRTHLLLLQNL